VTAISRHKNQIEKGEGNGKKGIKEFGKGFCLFFSRGIAYGSGLARPDNGSRQSY
jgi:hypothetical protein